MKKALQKKIFFTVKKEFNTFMSERYKGTISSSHYGENKKKKLADASQFVYKTRRDQKYIYTELNKTRTDFP